MTHLDFSRPATQWDGDTFEEENENMAALALQITGSDDDEEEDDDAVVAGEEVTTTADVPPVPVPDEEEDEEGEVDELKALDRLEKELKADEFGGISDLIEEEETI